MGGDEKGDPLRGQREQQVPELPARDRIDPRGRLVEEHHARLVQQRRPQRQPLLPAAREQPGPSIQVGADVGQGDDRLSPLAQALAGEPVDAGEEVEVLAHGQILVEREPLAHVADVPADRLTLAW